MDLSNVVIDTNVLVSGLRSKRGASYKLISLLGAGQIDKRDFEGVEMFGIETIDPKIFLEKIGALP